MINILLTLKILKKEVKGLYAWQGLEFIKECAREEKLFDNQTNRFNNDKTLSCMTVEFILLLKAKNSISLDKLGNLFPERSVVMHKSKMRRIYDISKILTGIGLIACTQNLRRITFIHWLGFDNVPREIENESVPIANYHLKKTTGSIF